MSDYMLGYIGGWALIIYALHSAFPKFVEGVWAIGSGAIIVAVQSAISFIMMLVSFMG